MTTVTDAAPTTQIYQVFIRAEPEAIWDAITSPQFTLRYFHGTYLDTNLEPGGPFRYRSRDRTRLLVDGYVVESEPPRKLVHTWRALYDPNVVDEQASRVTWEIEAQEGGYSKLTVVHDRLDGAPKTAAGVSGAGWMMVLSGLKTLVETGEPLFDYSA